MRIKYYPASLSPKELKLIDMILDWELGVQSWCRITYSTTLGEELLIGIQ